MALRKRKPSRHPDVKKALSIIHEVDTDDEYNKSQVEQTEWIKRAVDDGMAQGIPPEHIACGVLGYIIMANHMAILENEHGIKLERNDTLLKWANSHAAYILEDVDTIKQQIALRQMEKMIE